MRWFYSGRNITVSESGDEESMGMSKKKSSYAQLEDQEHLNIPYSQRRVGQTWTNSI